LRDGISRRRKTFMLKVGHQVPEHERKGILSTLRGRKKGTIPAYRENFREEWGQHKQKKRAFLFRHLKTKSSPPM